MTLNEKIVNVSTGEETIRPYTDYEIAEVEKSIAKAKAQAEIEAQKAISKAALFAKLNITEDEAKLLLS